MFSVIVLYCFNILLLVSSVLGLDVAMIDVVLVENKAGKYNTLTYQVRGRFSRAGAVTSAEGDILKLHGLNLCSSDIDRKPSHEYGWVGVMKIPPVGQKLNPCVSVVKKAEVAVQRGATAVIFDVTDNPGARKELEAKSGVVLRPVVIIEGPDAKKLENLLHERKLSRARIKNEAKSVSQATSNEYFDMGIFMAFFILVSLICLILLIKIKWRQKRKQTSLTRMALQAISRMETRKYTSELGSQQSLENAFICNRWPYYDIRSCAICLEEFSEGQDIRIVPCRHEFHKSCVDPWLLSNCTCPLCMLNIVEPFDRKRRSNSLRNQRRNGIFRYCIALSCGNSEINQDEISAEETFTNIELASTTNYSDPRLSYQSRRSIDSPNTIIEHSQQPSQSFISLADVHTTNTMNSDCLQPYRFPRCKFHHKKNRHRTTTSPPPEQAESDIEHSIVVVADIPVDNFDKMIEDVV
ncbi:E3 ubiquitin-protein ligase znrf3-like [Rhopilema esculentum]|uniref:E3 ubiquitin-protein ligase znrf3-like n=1 Tax=Rhopilema esculentum TaxID=499914 RepID=UPI0031DD1D8C